MGVLPSEGLKKVSRGTRVTHQKNNEQHGKNIGKGSKKNIKSIKKNIARRKSSRTWEGRREPLHHGGSKKNITREPRTRPT